MFDFKARCTQCGKETAGRLIFDKGPGLKIIDSDGGMLFEDGWCCHNCLGQPWSSADLVVGG